MTSRNCMLIRVCKKVFNISLIGKLIFTSYIAGFLLVFCSFAYPTAEDNNSEDEIITDTLTDELSNSSWDNADVSLDNSLSISGENEESSAAGSGQSEIYLTDSVLQHALELYGVADSTVLYDPDADYDEYNFSGDDWRLILVNKSHSIPDDYEVNLGTIYGSWKCDERVIPDLLEMLRDARSAGTGLYIASPYRNSATQITLYNNKITKFMNSGMNYLEAYKLAGQAVTIPGTSEHETGLCFDFLCKGYGKLDAGFADTAAGQWLSENAHYYGFILRYPKDKEYITTIEYEPWHFRYVGVEAATLIYNENLTLEEFWEKYLE